MANEGTISIRLSVAKSNLIIRKDDQISFSVAATPYAGGAQSIGTTYELLTMGDVATAGYGFLKNIDATNYVEVGIVTGATFYPLLKLLPGEIAAVRFAIIAIYAKANTADCVLEFIIGSA